MPEPTMSRRSLLQAAGAVVAVPAGSALSAPGRPTARQGNEATAPRPVVAGGGFVHPGILHTGADLDRMRDAVAERRDPIYQGFQAMAAHNRSSYSYATQNTGQITSWGRGPSNFMSQAVADSGAAYQNALMWAITGDVRHADKARGILNAWSASLTMITGADGQLGTGLQGFKFVNAAEILRHSGYDGWAPADIARCEESFRTVWYRSLSGHALFANGNWDAAALQTIIAVAVFVEDRTMFEEAVRYAVDGAGNGRITHLVVEPTGQGQESGRSQSYAQLGLGLLTNVAEVAWNQGVDLYGHADNRILAGYEYNSRYNLGTDDVPFVADLDRTGKYIKQVISTGNRGQFQPIYELAYAHYVSRLGLSAPETERVVFRGPGGGRVVEGNNDDHPAWGTLTHAQTPAPASAPQTPPGIPSGLTATHTPNGTVLTWAASVDPASRTKARHYTIRRSTGDGPAVTVAARQKSTSYVDRGLRPGQTCTYTVTATNEAGTSQESLPVATSGGLPAPWRTRDVGQVRTAGSTTFDGRTFVLEASGTSIGGTKDQFRFAYAPMHGDGTLTARIAFPLSSQYAAVGVMMRANLRPESAHAAMLIQGLPLHTWSGVWTTRDASGADTSATGSTPVPPTQQEAITTNAGFPISNMGTLPASATPLTAPHVEAAGDGYRLRTPYWVRITRHGATFTGSISADATTWTEVGSTQLQLDKKVVVGLVACSSLGAEDSYAETTTAAFDNVTVPGWSGVPPTAPTGTLRAIAGAGAVELAWSDLDLSARYTVKRALRRGGPYTPIATGVGPVGFGVETRYTDAAGTPGTTYHYVVTATNAAGESPPSAETTATMPTLPAPMMINPGKAFANVGEPFHYLIQATNNPSSYSAEGLPAGLRVDSRTGVISGTPTTPGTSVVQIGVRNATAVVTSSLTLTVGTPPPQPWRHRDIGDHVLDEATLATRGVAEILTPGITSYDPDTGAFIVRGAGSDLDVNRQGMTAHLAYVPVSGDGTIVARLANQSGAGTAPRAGLVMAKSLSPFDQVAGVVLTRPDDTSSGVVQVVHRSKVAAGLTTTEDPTGVDVPTWLRLRRSGTVFTAAMSSDGTTWIPVGDPVAVPDFGDAPYYVGLVVCSRNPNALATTIFDGVSVESL